MPSFPGDRAFFQRSEFKTHTNHRKWTENTKNLESQKWKLEAHVSNLTFLRNSEWFLNRKKRIFVHSGRFWGSETVLDTISKTGLINLSVPNSLKMFPKSCKIRDLKRLVVGVSRWNSMSKPPLDGWVEWTTRLILHARTGFRICCGTRIPSKKSWFFEFFGWISI